MREIALILLLILPGWHVFDGPRSYLSNSIKPHPQKVIVPQKLYTIIAPPRATSTDTFSSNSKALYSIDLETNAILQEKNKDTKLHIASLTKLMTAYIALKDTNNIDDVVTIPNYITQQGDALMGVYPGETIKKRDLIVGMLLSSGSDAATSLAILDSGTIHDFVTKMNSAVTSIGLPNTHFSNPVGWDETENYSSAKDIAELSRILLRNNFFAETVSTSQKVVYTTSGRPIYLSNTNVLLDHIKYFGIKTGYTIEAGECLASLEEVNGKKIITVILGTNNRFAETDAINSWIFTHFVW